MHRWLFIAQVFEGAVTWGEIKELPVDEIEFLFKEADDLNAKRRSKAK